MDEQQIIADARAWYQDSWDPSLTVGEWFRMMYDSGWGYPTWPEQCQQANVGCDELLANECQLFLPAEQRGRFRRKRGKNLSGAVRQVNSS